MSVVYIPQSFRVGKNIVLGSGQELTVTWGTNVDAVLGRGTGDTDITYLGLRNATGVMTYIYPTSDGNGIQFSTSKP